MVIFRVILILLAFIVVLLLALPNAQQAVEVKVFFRDYYATLAEIMLYSFAFGGVVVGIFTVVSEITLRARLHRQRRELEALTEELRLLRNAPLDGEYPPRPKDRAETADGGA
jgi:uncharacterized integral membrane protein